MRSARVKETAIKAPQLAGTEQRRQRARIDIFTSGVLRCQIGEAAETPLRGSLSAGTLDHGSVIESVATMPAMSRSTQGTVAARRNTMALLINAGAGTLCVAQHGRNAELAVGDAMLCDNEEPWTLSGDPNQTSRLLCIQVPGDLVRRHFDHLEKRAAVTIPAHSPALVLARTYMEGLLSAGDLDDAGLAQFALDHLAGLVAASAASADVDVASQPGKYDAIWTNGLERQSDIANRRLVARRAGVSRAESRAAISAATLDLMPIPVLILDAEGYCIDTNAAADRLLAATRLIRINSGVLVIADPDAHRRVAKAAKAAALQAGGSGAPTTLVALTLESNRHFAAQLIPLCREGLRPSDGIAALLLQEIGNLRPLSGEFLVKLYGLTRAEARLVTLLAQDFSLEDAAAALGIARSTAKTHLQHVFEKTGTNRQPQVVRLALSAIAAPAT